MDSPDDITCSALDSLDRTDGHESQNFCQKATFQLIDYKKKMKRQKRTVNMPITRGIVDELGFEMHTALLGMEHGDITSANWKRVGKILIVISIASDEWDKLNAEDKLLVDTGVLTLHTIADRELDTGSWRASGTELDEITAAVTASERMLPRLDYRRLVSAYRDVGYLVDMV